MLVQEPVQAAIWHCLNHYAYNDAIFLAERLRAEVETEETIWLLATCYYRSGKLAQAYSLLKNSSSPQCKFLLAKCCIDLQKVAEAESVIMGGELGKARNLEEVATEYGDISSFALTLIATVCFQTERHQRGVDASRKALLLNPFLWTVFETLCKKGDRPDPYKTFNPNSLESMSTVTGSNPIINYVNSQVIFETPVLYNNSSQNNIHHDNNVNISTPIQVVNMGNLCMSGIRAFSPESPLPIPLPPVTRPKRAIRYRNIFPSSLSPLTPSFGVIPLDLSPCNDNFISPVNTLSEVNEQKVIPKRQLLRKDTPLQQSKPIFHQSNTPGGAPSPTIHVQPSVRRSSRLFSNSYAVKENTKSPNRNKFATPNSPSRKTKCRLAKQALSRSNCSELNERNRSVETIIETPVITEATKKENKSATEQAKLLQTHSLEGLLLLMSTLGQGYLHLLQFDCKKAIEIFNSLPPHHRNTGWVLAMLGKAYFEMNDYKKACSMFMEVRKLEPERCTQMEIFSTALWHLQKDAALSSLAQDLVALDKHTPEAWCAAGNCYSLQKEHDVAIKFFQRAVQVDPNFAYAYTLLGHEYVVTEELDKGMSCFRNAVRLDARHYNAWYGIGTIYSKQEKFLLAELHYKRALSINPNSCVLMCHIGVVQMALSRKDEALETLNKALQLEPNNPLCKFHRASILASCNRHHEALTELEELKELVPKESLVYYLTGKVHKKLGNTHLALMHFSWATDLDPKGASTQIKDTVDTGISHIHDIGGDTSDDLLQRTPPQEVVGEVVPENDDGF
ncbi:cell division cycle protein 27 homolog [Cimex lectularius]|uniref:Cell division cycle protein 27 homolog n=1 Tax=Cimex lectularius TaxID=79782 RepID=A0A8I6RQW7_CIMLE|nr:cell division cycle protein 27 homolog [Cimex lectularius]